MRDVTICDTGRRIGFANPKASGDAAFAVGVGASERSTHSERIVIGGDPIAGRLLKFYSKSADVAYWTAMWRNAPDVPYGRALGGHMPHQLRDTFKRWVQPGARILEAGCGPAQFTVAARVLGYRAEGLDWSVELIERLRRRFPAIPWHVGDARALNFADGSFDAVYSPGVCEHFEEGPTAVLAETYRVLRPHGIALIFAPCFNGWLQRRTHYLSADGPGGLEFYQYAFSPEGMAASLTRLGLEVVQIRPYGTLATLERHGGWRVPSRWRDALAFPLDYLPGIRDWGSTCIWVGRKP